MLEMRQFCECCGKPLSPDKFDALICSFECTFCTDCAATKLRGKCPNCHGNLLLRPTRTAASLARNPASGERIVTANGCSAAIG